MSFSVAQRNAVFDAVKAKLFAIVQNEGGMFTSTIEGDITDTDILGVVEAGLAALAAATPTEAKT